MARTNLLRNVKRAMVSNRSVTRRDARAAVESLRFYAQQCEQCARTIEQDYPQHFSRSRGACPSSQRGSVGKTA